MNYIILAAGLGTRMKSDKAKVLHEIDNKPMIWRLISTIKETEPRKIIVIIGHQANLVKKALSDFSDLEFALQEKQLGTGHAANYGLNLLNEGSCIILPGDTPLITSNVFSILQNAYLESGKKLAFLTTEAENNKGLGRIVRKNNKIKIVEEKDASQSELEIKEVNTGIYVGDIIYIKNLLKNINNNNKQNEYYLTDIIKMASNENNLAAIKINDSISVMGINNLDELEFADKVYKQRISSGS
ncbi:MAG: NTP transferase domain-containing protein [Pseudomonadota bacterium]